MSPASEAGRLGVGAPLGAQRVADLPSVASARAASNIAGTRFSSVRATSTIRATAARAAPSSRPCRRAASSARWSASTWWLTRRISRASAASPAPVSVLTPTTFFSPFSSAR
jgi:hypothetical protein